MSITPRCDSATLPESRGIHFLFIVFHDNVPLGDVCLQYAVNKFLLDILESITQDPTHFDYSVMNFLGNV